MRGNLRSWSGALVGLFVLLGYGASAAAQDADASRDADVFGAPADSTAPVDASRDADIFGTAAEPGDAAQDVTTPASEAPPPPEQVSGAEAMFGADEAAGMTASGEIPGLVSEKEDVLDIGGLAYLRSTYTYQRKTVAGDAALRMPSFVDIYADARPSEQVRFFTKGRLRHDFTAPADSTTSVNSFGIATAQKAAALDQLWLNFDADHRVFITAGKQPLKWGSGRFWNPTDFLNPVLRDPLAAFDERLGVNLLKIHVPVEAYGMNWYAIADLEGAQSPRQLGAALRGEVVVGTAELALSAAARKDRPTYLGFDVSTALGDFDVRVETAVRKSDDMVFFRGELDPTTLPPTTPSGYSRKNDWIAQSVAGLEYAFNYSDQDSANVGVEYFYNDAGYDDASLYPWLLFSGAFRPLYLGKHYGAAYALVAGPGDWNSTTFIVSTLGNLSDKSYLARFDYRVNVLTYLNLDTYVNYHFGEVGEFNYQLRVPPVPFIPQLAQGLRTPQPLVDLGMGLRVAF